MSDSSNSTGSSGSSTNSWTLLSPEEAAIENVGPVDDGTESLGDAPSLSEEVAGAAAEVKPAEIPVETVLSEEGHQICQETSPESSEGPVPSSPARLSPLPPHDASYLDPESQPPIIHDIVTTSPSDNEPQGAMPLVTTLDLGVQLDVPAVEISPADCIESCSEVTDSAEPVLDAPVDSGLIPTSPAEESAVLSADVPTETLTAADASSHIDADVSSVTKSTEPPSLVPERQVKENELLHSDSELLYDDSDVDTPGFKEKATKTSESTDGEDEEEPTSSFELGDARGLDDGLRRRNAPFFEAPRPRTSDEEDDEEEVEFRLPEKKEEEKSWFSMNKCIVGAVVLLFLGSLFFSGDFDTSELTDGEQNQIQDGLSGDPQDMKELLDKLTQENQQITQLEAQLQTKKEEIDSQMEAVAVSGDEKGKADLEKENLQLKEELSILPELKKELESLRVRVTELSKITTNEEILPPASSSSSPPEDRDARGFHQAAGSERKKETHVEGNLKKELKRQKVLLEESRKRLEGMNKDGGDGKRVWERLEGIQKKLSEQVERWEKTKPQGSKWKGNKGKHKEREQWKKEEKKEEKHKEEKREKEWKPQKENSHKEAWRKHQDEWERKKGERRVDREERRKEKPWHSRPGKSPQSHHQHQHRQPHQHHDFWRDQEQKLHRNVRPQLGCTSVEDCAAREGLYPVELSEFELLLEGYLSKLEGSSNESKDKIRKLTADFFEDGVFIHDRVRFGDFAEDVADILEDMVDVLEGGGKEDSLEEEMEEFEREALWKFAASA